MSDTITIGASLDSWQRDEIARHVEQTRHMCYGGGERARALIFRLPYGHPDVIDRAVPAALLADLAAAARTGETVKVPRMSKQDRVRTSQLLAQSAARPAREGNARDDSVARELADLARSWDTKFKVPQDELERAEWSSLPAAALRTT